MAQSTTRSVARLGEAEILHQLALQLAQIQAASAVAQHGVHELERTHQEVSALYQKTLTAASQAIQEASQCGRLTAFKLAALYHRTEAYRYEMLSIVEETGDDLINNIDRG